MASAAAVVAPPRLPRRTTGNVARPSSGNGAAQAAVAPVSSARMSPRRPSSPHQFIHECQVQGRLRSSALIPVKSESSSSAVSTPAVASTLEANAQQQSYTPRPPPMSHPLFAGWCDAGLFASLLSKDVARLQRRLADMRRSCRAAGEITLGRKDLADPMGCVRTLAGMLLQPAVEACKQKSHNGGSKAASRRTGPDTDDPWRSLCNELAERAAHLEVLLGVLAEVMVLQVLSFTPGASAGRAAVADAAGCPSTRIGWVDEAIGALESLADRTVSSVGVPGQLQMRAEDHVEGIKCSVSKTVSVQTVENVRTLAAVMDAPTQTEGVDTTCQATAGTDSLDSVVLHIECMAQAVQTELPMRDVSTLTEPLEESASPPSSGSSLCDAGTQAEPLVCDAALQAASSTLDASMQTAVESAAAQTQTATAQGVSSATQTDPMAAPKPGGLREKKLNAEEAIQQLTSAREKLKLEREAASTLETNLGAAGRTIAELKKEAQALRTAAATSAKAAEAAAWRPPTVEASTQDSQELSEAEVQTDPAVFYTHSWQSRPDSAKSARRAANVETGIDAAVQTPCPPPVKSSSTQTWRTKQGSRDACVGGEEPLRLALGAADLPDQCPNEPWRCQYSHGMQALVEQWQGRWEAAEAERKRLEALLSSGDAGNVGSARQR